ncbi:hypothetical protein T440DRAFT_14002 [Plenodomus tracheiphilus IPT5]|uniref:Uncharacterized protein n=1 Tax=Plenodomus tracheiphilus IPT5 TaxID=1408161 RepID=A0A6A7BNJ3_9PLEO|nr:hypothetical protein T440DRAFT_14002 [Plenodomus tracheiphilus IPT5]
MHHQPVETHLLASHNVILKDTWPSLFTCFEYRLYPSLRGCGPGNNKNQVFDAASGFQSAGLPFHQVSTQQATTTYEIHLRTYFIYCSNMFPPTQVLMLASGLSSLIAAVPQRKPVPGPEYLTDENGHLFSTFSHPLYPMSLPFASISTSETIRQCVQIRLQYLR